MAESNPTGDSRLVPLDLPRAQVEILRERLTDWLDGIRSDLETPEKVKDPGHAQRESAAFARLQDALERRSLAIPDGEAWAALSVAAAAYDDASGYAEATANHDAMQALLDRLAGEAEDERELQRRVLDRVLGAHPESFVFDDLGAALLMDPPDLTKVIALTVAVRDLVLVGLLQSDGLRVLPTPAALHYRCLEKK